MSTNKHDDLGILQMQALWLLGKHPSHGYDLMRQLSEIKNAKITQGTLYPLLGKLQKRGLIASRTEGKRGKKTYHLTKTGKQIMTKNCAEFVTIFSGIISDYRCSSCKK